MARRFITGDDKIEAALKHLADKAADKIAKSAISAGLTVMVKAEKKEAPVGKTKAVQKSIGKRFERNKKANVVTAKAGVNVGKRTAKKIGREAPHSHLVILGTKPRHRKKIGGKFSYLKNPTSQQLSTGSGSKNGFIRRAVASSESAVVAAMQKRASARLITEALAAKK